MMTLTSHSLTSHSDSLFFFSRASRAAASTPSDDGDDDDNGDVFDLTCICPVLSGYDVDVDARALRVLFVCVGRRLHTRWRNQ